MQNILDLIKVVLYAYENWAIMFLFCFQDKNRLVDYETKIGELRTKLKNSGNEHNMLFLLKTFHSEKIVYLHSKKYFKSSKSLFIVRNAIILIIAINIAILKTTKKSYFLQIYFKKRFFPQQTMDYQILHKYFFHFLRVNVLNVKIELDFISFFGVLNKLDIITFQLIYKPQSTK